MKITLILKTPEAAKALELSEFPAVIGRHEECAVVLVDPRASRRHATIECRRGKPCLVDLDSGNGTFVNGIRSRECFLAAGDEVLIGSTSLRVETVQEDVVKAAPPSEAVTRSLRRRRIVSRIAPAVILLLMAGGIALWLLAPREPEPVASRGRPGEAEVALEALKSEAGRAPQVTADLLERARALKAKYRDVTFPAGGDPFADFLVALRSRQTLEISNRLFRLNTEVAVLLEGQRYGEALRLAVEETDRIRGECKAADDAAANLRSQTEREALAAYRRLEVELGYLEDLEREDDYMKAWERGQAAFAGTPPAGNLSAKLDSFKARLASSREKALELERLSREAAELEVAAAKRTRRKAAGLLGLLTAPIAGGKLQGRKYRFGDFEGSPAAVNEDGGILVRGEGVERSFADVSAAVQFQMAADALSGDGLLDAARLGYRQGLGKEADGLLLKYLNEDRESRGARKVKADRLLASVRGLPRVPEGGFTYATGIGWEDAEQAADRIALASMAQLGRALASALSLESLKRNLGKLDAILGQRDISRRARAQIRENAIESLGRQREKTAKQLLDQGKNAGFQVLRSASVELKARRAAALKVIFDTSVYLPENHPDHPKGDRVNGQEAVDKAVAAVRELWENAGNYAVSIDPRSQKMAEMVRILDGYLVEKLEHRSEKQEGGSIQEILNNLDQRVDLKRFASSRAEADLYAYNRKVEAYNRGLQDPELSDGEKAHVEYLNDYREMLGLRRLFIELRLCRATGKHSVACNQAGRIWHAGPDGSPESRARAEGFPGGVAENVAIGYANPKDIWTRGWYRASDHHRNALGAGHNCIGYGYAGNVGTQNFAVAGAPFR